MKASKLVVVRSVHVWSVVHCDTLCRTCHDASTTFNTAFEKEEQSWPRFITKQGKLRVTHYEKRLFEDNKLLKKKVLTIYRGWHCFYSISFVCNRNEAFLIIRQLFSCFLFIRNTKKITKITRKSYFPDSNECLNIWVEHNHDQSDTSFGGVDFINSTKICLVHYYKHAI